MNLKTSLFSKTIIKNDLKTYGFLGILYTAFLAIIIPITKWVNIDNGWHTELDFNISIYIIPSIIIPMVVAFILFRYIQDTAALSKIHSLPFTRIQLYNSHIISGLILLVLPVIFNCLLLTFVLFFMNYLTYIPISTILLFCIDFILTELVIFMTITMFNMALGSYLIYILPPIFLILPYGLSTLFDYIFLQYLYGYPIHGRLPHNLWYDLSPLFSVNSLSSTIPHSNVLLIFIIYIIIFYIMGLGLYTKKHLERNREAFSFNWIKHMFLIGITVCFTLVTGMLTQRGYYNNILTYYAGCLIGSIIGYIIGIKIAYNTFNIFKHYKTFIGIFIGTIFLFSFIRLDILGYETRTPEVNNVEYVAFYYNNSNYPYSKDELNAIIESSYISSNGYTYNSQNIYEKPSNIQTILNMHQTVINTKDEDTHYPHINVTFLYQLKNGQSLLRIYPIPTDLIADYMDSLYTSKEFKEKNISLYQYDDSEIKSIILQTKLHSDSKKIEDQAIIKELIAVLRNDIQSLSSTDYLKVDDELSIILVYNDRVLGEEYISSKDYNNYYNKRYYNYTINDAYINTLNYLQ